MKPRVLVAILLITSFTFAAETEVLLKNPAFTEGVSANGVPLGWSLYGGRGVNQRVAVVDDGYGGKAVLIEDGDREAEVGITQVVPVKPNVGYEVRVRVRAVKGASDGYAVVQLRFLPSQTIAQTHLVAQNPDEYNEIAVRGMAPPDTKAAQIYLYSHAHPTPRVLIGGVRLIAGVQPPPPLPLPVPPQYSKLKDLYLTTHIVRDGKPAISIVTPTSGIYKAQAARLQAAIEKLTGCKVPIIADGLPEAAVPIKGSLIVLGNRSTNVTISELYNRYFLLTDLRYPSVGGYELRTIHNPFGGGHNVIVVGGSDAKGVDAATDALIATLRRSDAPRSTFLSVGWLMQIKLGDGIVVPRNVRELETWEASKGYGSVGYFGWNSISKRMAAYYMSGDPFHAREALRLAFPDKQAFKEITEIDGEMIENKDDPLAGTYHYTSHMMILFWDLIEESSIFTDEERLKVINAFARQLNHRKDEGVYRLARPPSAVGSRHGQWSAISLYCLGRYFQRDYAEPVWAQCVRGSQFHFAPLHEQAWIAGENDNLFWYCTGIAPVFTYMVLSGDREPMRNGVAAKLLRGQELLISGRVPDWALNSAALDYLHKAAYLTQDGRWLAYRDRTGINTNVFRLGQSFWPDDKLKPAQPTDLVGKWTVNHLPKPHWLARNNGFPLEESFQNASFRSATDASGDFILIDGFNGASRNPYHTFALLELRLAGQTILQGYLNQVLTKADGMVEPQVAMDAALRCADVIGQTAVCVGETPKAAFCNWRRTLAQRTGRYALVVDDLTFRSDSQNMEVQLKWENQQGGFRFDAKQNALRRPGAAVLPADVFARTTGGGIVTQEWNGAVKKGQHGVFFALFGTATNELYCLRLADNAAALALPQKAAAIIGDWEGNKGDLVLLAEDYLFGVGLTQTGKEQGLLLANAPVDVEWDFTAGRMEVVTRGAALLTVAVADATAVHSGNQIVKGNASASGYMTILLRQGRTVIEGIKPSDAARRDLATQLAAWFEQASSKRALIKKTAPAASAAAAELKTAFTAQVGGPVRDLIVIPADGRELIAAAEETTIHLLGADGQELRQMRADGKIRQLHWWPEHKLLLAGCEDEKVCAFDLAGERKWTFVSEMDPAVFRAAKQYWFKSAPGHGGIHGVGSGVFLDGESQAFVGSACTLEIIDENGKLVKRMPQFWGTVYKFALVPGPEGSVNLLASRKITDGPSLGVINNRTLNPTARSFYGVPAGHTHVSGWMDQTRHHIFVEDLDGDGKKEVVSEITGAWNRVTVWDLQGKPLHNVQFGPGARDGGRDIRDLDLGHLDDDGKKEIVVALSNGLVVALNHCCEKLWSKRLNSSPVVLKVAGSSVIVASENGSVLMLDSRGNVVSQGKLNGRPTCIQKLTAASFVVIASEKGEIKAFSAERGLTSR
ncbi:MAG: hypothetical protein WCV00_12525 [Verrucomicrobiia bacterium]|jgi:hypothetical protein